MTYGFKSHLPHQSRESIGSLFFFFFMRQGLPAETGSPYLFRLFGSHRIDHQCQEDDRKAQQHGRRKRFPQKEP